MTLAEFGIFLRSARKSLNLSQTNILNMVSQLKGYPSISASTIYRIERGLTSVRLDSIMTYMRAVSVPNYYLLLIDDLCIDNSQNESEYIDDLFLRYLRNELSRINFDNPEEVSEILQIKPSIFNSPFPIKYLSELIYFAPLMRYSALSDIMSRILDVFTPGNNSIYIMEKLAYGYKSIEDLELRQYVETILHQDAYLSDIDPAISFTDELALRERYFERFNSFWNTNRK